MLLNFVSKSLAMAVVALSSYLRDSLWSASIIPRAVEVRLGNSLLTQQSQCVLKASHVCFLRTIVAILIDLW